MGRYLPREVLRNIETVECCRFLRGQPCCIAVGQSSSEPALRMSRRRAELALVDS